MTSFYAVSALSFRSPLKVELRKTVIFEDLAELNLYVIGRAHLQRSLLFVSLESSRPSLHTRVASVQFYEPQLWEFCTQLLTLSLPKSTNDKHIWQHSFCEISIFSCSHAAGIFINERIIHQCYTEVHNLI